MLLLVELAPDRRRITQFVIVTGEAVSFANTINSFDAVPSEPVTLTAAMRTPPPTPVRVTALEDTGTRAGSTSVPPDEWWVMEFRRTCNVLPFAALAFGVAVTTKFIVPRA